MIMDNLNDSSLPATKLVSSQGKTAFETILNNPNATLLESIFVGEQPIFAIWETNNIKLIEPQLEEICLTFHITGSIRVRNNVIGHNNVKFNSIALYGLNSYEWNLYNKLRYAHLYFWKDIVVFNPEEIAHALQNNELHGIKDNWVEGLFKMILSYKNSEERKTFILKMYQECFAHLKDKYLDNFQEKNVITGGFTSFQVKKLQEFIEHNYMSKINIEDFCNTMNWSRSHLFREFKKTFGTTPYNFLSHKRLSIIKELLAAGQPIDQVCQNSGVENINKINYLFQKHMGISLKEYLQQNPKEKL